MALALENVGKTGTPTERSWTSADVMLYALAVGAGQDDASAELQFTTENSAGVELQVLPSFANLLALGAGLELAGDIELRNVLHAEQAFELHRPLPAKGTAVTQGTLTGIYDKGNAALITAQSRSTDARTGELLATCRMATHIRGAGGFGGERGPSSDWVLPDRQADFRREVTIPADQALLYRLTGDRNPLHSDPSFAQRAGFDRPILHGMCTYGYTARILLHAFCGSRVERFTGMSGRFSSIVHPGDTIVIEGWEEGERVLFRTLSGGAVVVDHGLLRRKSDD